MGQLFKVLALSDPNLTSLRVSRRGAWWQARNECSATSFGGMTLQARHARRTSPASATLFSPARAACRRASMQASMAASAPTTAQERVAENRARMAAALGCPPDNLLSPYQIHSPNVVVAR